MTAPAATVDRLLAIRAAALASAPAEAAAWFAAAVDEYLATAGDLDECLGLRPTRGGMHPARAWHLARRNEWLARAYAEHPRRDVFHAEVSYFRDRFAKSDPTLTEPPADWPRVHRLLWHAFRHARHSSPVPDTWSWLAGIVQRNAGFTSPAGDAERVA